MVHIIYINSTLLKTKVINEKQQNWNKNKDKTVRKRKPLSCPHREIEQYLPGESHGYLISQFLMD